MNVHAYLDAKRTARFRCPNCEKRYHRDLSRFQNIGPGSKVKCRCPCGSTFVITLERRKEYRKPIEISGGYHHERFQFRGSIAIQDISKSGAGFEISDIRKMAVGDTITLKFNLNDDNNSFVAKEAVIRKIEGRRLGVEFLSKTWDGDALAAFLKGDG